MLKKKANLNTTQLAQSISAPLRVTDIYFHSLSLLMVLFDVAAAWTVIAECITFCVVW